MLSRGLVEVVICCHLLPGSSVHPSFPLPSSALYLGLQCMLGNTHTASWDSAAKASCLANFSRPFSYFCLSF